MEKPLALENKEKLDALVERLDKYDKILQKIRREVNDLKTTIRHAVRLEVPNE